MQSISSSKVSPKKEGNWLENKLGVEQKGVVLCISYLDFSIFGYSKIDEYLKLPKIKNLSSDEVRSHLSFLKICIFSLIVSEMKISWKF